jgi:excisionase family DNA binding protein
MNQVPVLFTTSQTAEIMNISRTKVYELMNKGELDSLRIGRSRRISTNQIETFIKNMNRKTIPVS